MVCDSDIEIHVDQENSKDILTYLKNRLQELQGQTIVPISDLIQPHANGLFIWARLVVDQVLDLKLEEDLANVESKITETINKIPKNLKDLYHEIIHGMDDKAASLRLIQWIRCARRVLYVDELRWAMVIEADPTCKSLDECKKSQGYIKEGGEMQKRIKTLGGGLVETMPSPNGSTVQFIHQSVTDFFNNEETGADSATGIAHYQIYQTCIRYLDMEEIGLIRELSEYCWWQGSMHPGSPRYLKYNPQFPLLVYATWNWINHLRCSRFQNICPENLPCRFNFPSARAVQYFVRLVEITSKGVLDRPPTGASLTHILSRYGLTTLLEIFLQQRGLAEINARDCYGRTPLLYASERGHIGTAETLLMHGADVNAQDSVAEEYKFQFFRLKLDAGSNSSKSDYVLRPTESNSLLEPLIVPEHVAGLSSLAPVGASPLHWACLRGNTAIVSLLLDNRADIEAKAEGRCTPLAWAIESQADSGLKILLESNPKLDCQYALFKWKWEIDNSLEGKVVYRGLSFCVDSPSCLWMPEPRYRAGGEVMDPLTLWMVFRDLFLSPRGVREEYADRTPLLRAIELENYSFVSMLLEKGASPDFEASNGWSPLALARKMGSESLIKLLEEHQKPSSP
jgi:ankyrin repeat protein